MVETSTLNPDDFPIPQGGDVAFDSAKTSVFNNLIVFSEEIMNADDAKLKEAIYNNSCISKARREHISLS